ncbi:unnamed protein product (macronuclear) [Paramecium tetraurelia]|uniref:Uncharacterized protein n=1 Tax=Paramecium tetraurelia TaxID=5888 RepID=A0DX88_PARTE|nr:uncharacterized protein GSPATT00021287001 [Paramecium tetraurelia]CAK87655.1 unnamed protein product [Paramecium tetraurelia]|eukprot:XP_001455052.1 hypothetical protein (macronuclear) [Paramecium tetraurelia strain d4-2]
MNNYHYLLKFIIIGDTCVGKSCLLLQFTDSRFRNEHDATIGVEFGSRNTKINDKTIKLQVWDTAGQEAFKSITRSYYRGSIGGILVFDVTSRQSFEGVAKWYQEIQGYACDKIEMALVANKIDLDAKREVQTEEAQAFAKKHGFAYFETSAKTGENVDTVFESMAQTILKRIDSGEIDPSQEIYGIKVGPGTVEVQKKQAVTQDPQNPKPLTGYTTPAGNKKAEKKEESCC